MTKQDAPTTTDAERAARDRFEAWVMAQPDAKPSDINRRDMPGSDRIGQYVNFAVEFAWQAARASSAAAQPDIGALQAELAGSEASIGHLSRMADDVQRLLDKAVKTMTSLHNASQPVDESKGDFDARIPYEVYAEFVDVHAELLHAVRTSPYLPAPPAKPAETGEAPSADA